MLTTVLLTIGLAAAIPFFYFKQHDTELILPTTTLSTLVALGLSTIISVLVMNSSYKDRYGEDGSQAMFQWLQENNLAPDAQLYSNLQTTIEAGRNKFDNSQEKLIDATRTYETLLGTFWTGLWMNIAGYPKIDLADYDIIRSQHAIDTYETGVDMGINF